MGGCGGCGGCGGKPCGPKLVEAPTPNAAVMLDCASDMLDALIVAHNTFVEAHPELVGSLLGASAFHVATAALAETADITRVVDDEALAETLNTLAHTIAPERTEDGPTVNGPGGDA